MPIIYESVNDRWEVGFTVSNGQFSQVSFVNSICTTKGGQHVNYIADQVTQHLVKAVTRKNKSAKVRPHQVKHHLTVFVRALIENPAFDSQTKETLTTVPARFGSAATVSSATLKKLAKSEVVKRVLNWAKFKQANELKRKGGRKVIKLVRNIVAQHAVLFSLVTCLSLLSDWHPKAG